MYLCAENFHASVTHATRASADVNMDEFHFTHKILQIDELFLETSSPNTLVIAINTHGFPDSGHFIDYSIYTICDELYRESSARRKRF